VNPIFPGVKVEPGDSRYPTLVRGFNQRFVGAPAFVQVCGDAKQVLQAVQQAVDQNLRITVRGGGHCYEDFVSGNDGGVIIDLSPLNAVYRDGSSAGGELYCVEGGCTLWNVYTQLFKEYGKTIPGGSCYSVGAGGHVIGGGYGLLSRLHGLTIDYLYAVELVHVNENGSAQLVKVSRDSQNQDERDLFWAHQGGGGGNFGIVTKYWFIDPPAAPDFAFLCTMAWDWDKVGYDDFFELVTNYGEFLKENSQDGSPYAGMFTLLHLTQKAASQIVLTMQLTGAPENKSLLENFKETMTLSKVPHVSQRIPVGFNYFVPDSVETRYMPWLEVTQTLDGVGANQRGKYKSAYMIEPFPKNQVDVMWNYLTTDSYTNPQALLQIDSYGCRINAVAPDATAVPQRSSIMKLQYQTYWTKEEDDAKNLDWIRNFYTDMYGANGPYPDGVMDGCYVNYPDTDLNNWQYLYYKDNYPKLQQVKQKWDALNIFNHKQSIELL
jgi:FAD/FMN-containing dehydrogenase